MRLSIIRVNWEICCWPVMFAVGMSSCAIAVHFHPRGFALPLLVTLPFGLPHPPTSWFMVGPWCSGKYTYYPLRISVWQEPGRGDPWEVAMVTPLFAFCPHLLITCFAVNWHLPSIFYYCLINKLTSIFSIRQRFTNSRNFTSTV